MNARSLTCLGWIATLLLAASNAGAVDKSENVQLLHQHLETAIVSQPPYSAFPNQGLSAGPVWTTRNVAYTGRGCTFGWIRSFQFSSSRDTEPQLANRFNEQFGGTKAFAVDLTRELTVESVPDAPNRLAEVDYALEEVMFRGDGLLSGGTVVEMSGLIVGDSDVRQTLVTLISKLKTECANPLDVQVAAPACGKRGSQLAEIAKLRHQGRLEQAAASIDSRMADGQTSLCEQVRLRLEKARVLDRIGLHKQTRPVMAAAAEIDAAEVLAKTASTSPLLQAEIEYGRAYFHYRAELLEREFGRAEAAVQRAIALAAPLGPSALLADATHLAGLIHLFRQDTGAARALFDRSLVIDRDAGERLFMIGEYHRHVALSYVFDDAWDKALPHYEKSHSARVRNDQIDGSFFSALSLGDALNRNDAPKEAQSYFRYALATAREIDSPYGVTLASLRLGDYEAEFGDKNRAAQFYEEAEDMAESIRREDLAQQALAALQRLKN